MSVRPSQHPRDYTPAQRREGLRAMRRFMESMLPSEPKPLSTPAELAEIDAEFDRPLTARELAQLVNMRY
jgi:hypothetical protein